MSDSTHSPDTSDGTSGTGRGRDAAPTTPRWVKVSGALVGVLILAFLVLHLAGGGMGSHH